MNILIKSENRTSGPSHNCYIELRNILDGEYVLTNAAIPNTMYNVTTSNNQLSVRTALNPWTTIQLTPGNYSAFSLSVELKTRLDAFETTFTASISNISGLLTISKDTWFQVRFTNSGDLLGFNTNRDTQMLLSYTGEDVIDLSFPVSLGINISETTSDNYENLATGQTGNLYIPMSLEFGFYKMLPMSDFKQSITLRRTRNLRIEIVNTSDSSQVNLNGGNYELLLTRI